MSHGGSEPADGTAEPWHEVVQMKQTTGTKNRMGRKSTRKT
jgi:hypothetical protein